MTIVLIFGTFNPVTKAHIRMGIIAGEIFPDSRIIYIPSKNRFLQSWKGMSDGKILDGDKRVELLTTATAPYGFEVDDLEITTDISGKTYDTIDAVKKKYSTDDIVICMGTDKVGELHTWYRGEELIAENRFLIISRDDNGIDDSSEAVRNNRNNFILIDNCDFNTVSASMIRAAYINGELEKVKDSIPQNVYDYLYNTEEVYR